jgi:serine/threonine protein kinase/tetratricopeptide (TPR) repeat protein
MIGTTVSQYKILEKIGQGGMGIVYKAQDIRLDRFVALKFLPAQTEIGESLKARFVNEAKAASALDHPNIGTIYQIDETSDGQMYIAMAYYEGTTLREKISSGKLSFTEAIDIALQIATGLIKAHERGIIHRDLKPANVLLTNDGVAKIIDFGLAKLASKAELTKTGMLMGTLSYMSPEQIQAQEIDARTDIWSLGVMLNEMLESKLPFKGEFEAAMMYSILNDNPVPLSLPPSEQTTALQQCIYTALQKDRALRYQTIAQFLEDLAKAREGKVGVNTSSRMKEPSKLVTEPPVSQRKLAAIMFTDMKGFSKKMGKDETQTMQLLRTHNMMMYEVVARHGGNVIKTVGDAFLVSFESVVTAVKCAADVQQAFHDYNTDKPDDERIVIRIGVHVGDIIVENNDVFGDGVNIAARIQPLATPGGISISEDVARQTRGKLEFPLQVLGKGELKNIDIPVVIYKVILPWEKAANPFVQRLQFIWKQKQAKKVVLIAGAVVVLLVGVITQLDIFRPRYEKSDLTLAVMPFVNQTDPSDTYLSEGIAEDVIRHLNADSNLLVISYSSSFFYKGKNITDKEIAKELNVRFLLKGTMQIDEGNVNIYATMFDAKENNDIEFEPYSLPRSIIVEVQERITTDVLKFFRFALSGTKSRKGIFSPASYETYLRGLYHLREKTKEANDLAIEYLQEAVAIDSQNTKVLVGLADAQAKYYERWEQSPNLLLQAERHCFKALEIDSLMAGAYAILGYIERLRGNNQKALQYCTKAIDIEPYNLDGITELAALCLFDLNEIPKAIKYLKRVQELEPTSPLNYSNLGVAYGQQKNYADAITAFRRSLQFDPNEDYAWSNLGNAFERIEKFDSALVCYRKCIELVPLEPTYYLNLTGALYAMRRYEEAESVLTVGLKNIQGSYELFYAKGVIYTLLKKPAEARRSFQDGLYLVESKLKKESMAPDYHSYAALFHARLGNAQRAIDEAQTAFKIYESAEIMLANASVFAILKQKTKMLEWFEKAHKIDPQYDVAFLKTAIDFETYQNDPDLLLRARVE